MKRRMNEHSNEKPPHWFGYSDRKKWEKIIVIKGNYERMIKNIGARKMVKILESVETPCTLWGC